MKKLFFISILLLSSCAAPTVQHPGALNSFDNYAYDTLLTEQAAINQAKTSVATIPNLKATLNIIIAQYNTTIAAYKIYHTAIAAGQNPDSTNLNTEIQGLVVQITQLLQATGVKL